MILFGQKRVIHHLRHWLHRGIILLHHVSVFVNEEILFLRHNLR